MIFFKIIFTLFAISGAFLVWQRRHEGLLSLRAAIWWLLIWVGMLVMAWYPNSVQTAADILGIGRGVDLVIYCALAFILLTIFRLSVKLESLQRDITKVVRHNALENKERRASKDAARHDFEQII